jgi:predicted nucleic acid-binding protein
MKQQASFQAPTSMLPISCPIALASVALKKSERYPTQTHQIASALEAVLSLDISLVSVAATDVLALALGTELTVYDAAYFHLAQNLKCPLVTFDERLARQTV